MYFNMSTKKKRKKKNSRRSALVPVILILIVIMVALVAVWQLRGVIGSKATTARAVARTMGNSYSGTVVIARNERLYETENKTSIDFVAAEGSHVSRSGVICKVYSSGYNQTEINRLQTYRQEIQSYHVSTVFGSYVDAALDSENEDPLDCAVRELKEETGLSAEHMTHLTTILTTPGFCTEKIAIYLAQGLSQGETHPDEDEFLGLCRLPLEEAFEMVMRGEIHDSKTICGLMMAREAILRQKEEKPCCR